MRFSMSSVDEKNKSTLKVDENDILKYAGKIEKNAAEDSQFSKKIDAYINKELKPDEVLRVGTTPNVLKIVGAQAIPIIVTQGVIANSMEGNVSLSNNNRKKHTEQHDVPVEAIKALPKALRNPILICKGNREDTLVVLTELRNKENQNIVIPIELSVKGKHGRVNRVSTIHGKKNIQNYLSRVASAGDILAMNKKEADQMYSDHGIQSPTSTTIICFDRSIAYSMQNVKGFEENLEKNAVKKTNDKQHKQQDNPVAKEKKIFTFSRKKLNENARKIKEQPEKDRNCDRSKKHDKER